MKVDLTDILSSANKEETKTVPVDMMSFDSRLGSFPITKKEEVALHIYNEENKRLLIRANTEITVAIPCDRCLKDVETTIPLDIDKEIPIHLENQDADDEEMEKADYMIGFHLDFDRIIYDEVLVNWPMKVLCKEDCAGICKKCGQNLNEKTCGCDKTELDPRMAVIQDVFNKFKEV